MNFRPWGLNFKGTVIFIAYVIGCIVLGYVVGFVLYGDGMGLAAVGLLVGGWVGWFKTRGPQFYSEERRREIARQPISDQRITAMRRVAMKRQPVATIGCVTLYFLVFGGGFLLFLLFLRSSG